MLVVTKENTATALLVKLAGAIEEDSDLSSQVGEINGNVVFSCKDVSRINSSGVKVWMKYFQQLAEKKILFRFIDVVPVIVEQVNLIRNFCYGGPIDSVFLPYNCTSCKTEFTSLFSTEELRKLNRRTPQCICPKCGNKAQFDEIEDEYLSFVFKNTT